MIFSLSVRLSVCPPFTLEKCPNAIYSLIFVRIFMAKVPMKLSFHSGGFKIQLLAKTEIEKILESLSVCPFVHL